MSSVPRCGWLLAALGAVALAACASGGGRAAAAAPGAGEYTALVASESADEVSWIRFGPGGAEVVRREEVGIMPADVDGPHGLSLSPDGRHMYVSIAHGTPFGSLWKLSTRTGKLEGKAQLGLFPATIGITPDGRYAFVSNFNLHGDPIPSTVSKVYLPTMTEVEQTPTCVMPHGGRVNGQGTRAYSVCMMDDELVEIDVATGKVARRFSVRPGEEGTLPERTGEPGMRKMGGQACSPTWAQPSADGSKVYVACNKADVVLEVDVASWSISRRFPTGPKPYNLAASADGRYLLATLKNRDAPATEVFDLARGTSLARVPNTAMLPHGVAVTPDSRYAVVSVEGVGAEPGKVDVIDLRSLQRTASVGVGPQAGGIDVLPGR